MMKSASEIALRKELRRLAAHLRRLARGDQARSNKAKHVHIKALYLGIAEGSLQAASFIEESLGRIQ